MRNLILALAIGLFISCDSNIPSSYYWSPPTQYVCKENSRKNCDCCKTITGDLSNTCTVGYSADRLFMPCVDAREFGYKVEK